MNVFLRILILILSKLFYNLLLYIYENIVLKYIGCDYIREN